MGGINLDKLGRYYDPTTKAGRKHILLPGFEDVTIPPTPELPPPPDITDKAVQEARRREEFRTGSGSRRNSFITGPLGDSTNIPVLGKSIITGG